MCPEKRNTWPSTPRFSQVKSFKKMLGFGAMDQLSIHTNELISAELKIKVLKVSGVGAREREMKRERDGKGKR